MLFHPGAFLNYPCWYPYFVKSYQSYIFIFCDFFRREMWSFSLKRRRTIRWEGPGQEFLISCDWWESSATLHVKLLKYCDWLLGKSCNVDAWRIHHWLPASKWTFHLLGWFPIHSRLFLGFVICVVEFPIVASLFIDRVLFFQYVLNPHAIEYLCIMQLWYSINYQ